MALTRCLEICDLGDRLGGVIRRHIDQAFREVLAGPNVVKQRRYLRLVTCAPHPFGNFACMSDPPAADVEATREAIGPLAQCQAPSAVFFVGGVEQPIEDLLAASGFLRHGGLMAMAVDIERLVPTTLPPGCTLARVTRKSDRQTWADVFARGYELPIPVGAEFVGGINDDDSHDAPMQYFWILKNGKPVCTSMMYLHDGVAGIYAVATLIEERGKGLGAHVTAEPLRRAHALGYRVGVLQASEAGHPIYRRLGFADYGELPLYVRMG